MYELYAYPEGGILRSVWTNGGNVFIVGEDVYGLVSIRGNINN
jgi:hypothetical protein